MLQQFNISNPKRSPKEYSRTNWFPYYAGFSSEFIYNILCNIENRQAFCIADPWNGGGTTTTMANAFGFESKGVDLNPIMLIAAKACLLNVLDIPSIVPITNDIVKKSHKKYTIELKNDPLGLWLNDSSVKCFRNLELAIKHLLISPENHNLIINLEDSSGEGISCIACFFYICLFRTLRGILKNFLGSNPTWVKIAKNENSRIDLNSKVLINLFQQEIDIMLNKMSYDVLYSGITNARTNFSVASSELLPWQSESIDLIITSPPYCTRIDYAVATMPELAILGIGNESGFSNLRRNLIGTTTVPKNPIDISSNWGDTCTSFLNKVYNHSSRASKTYYYKSHTSYFNSIFLSLNEINRVLKKNGNCIIVVQDSYYKDIHNNLPQILIEMSQHKGLKIKLRKDFRSNTAISSINPRVKKYRSSTLATESVICLEKIND
ncbi:DNA methyltransferase [Fibrella sp. WM1]|uniref:DNA methyltransferase n=1 Tax=Fibrella musci TaxID=3242485 RepID=UPI00351FE9B6